MATAILNGAPFTDVEKEALEVVDRLAEDPRLCLDMTFERGDIQAVNNFTTLHARTEFEDYDEPHLKRRLTRGWLATNTRLAVG
jgi:alpha-ketoglutarate-dependent taurine dioxygenase